ncbi:unnamed protein product [Rhizoctonia solani]|uniref:HNH nuclease domain-containing protein n=3 Tax=Rhizoctonia solani TaxID=456999 RepID=A0A8H2XXA2_9AGAM|nr:hypothetical protein RSOL_072960 [Rhizoctonia solani AG-3 Rhs1AP]KEP48402.1 hypothetical protein V565_125640 [Rhizoctonia solani 123E]CAE6433026.1 unnamed protein product [Rhizoctonia solani]CAE6438871.1 unnamed protein product [Rhizoctonia solani]
MSSQLIFDATATDDHLPDPSDIIDSQLGTDTQLHGEHWWESAVSVSLHTVSTKQRDALASVSPLGKRCVMTGEEYSIEMAHLIPRCTRSRKLQKLQYTFGRILDVNSRWFSIYLKSDFHGAFHKSQFSWALIPTPTMITQIANKLRSEKGRRLQFGIQGPWPDYRQRSWFPITAAGFDYQFVALGFARPNSGSIHRLEELDDPNAPPRATRHFDPPSFEGFPTLRLSAHPYAMVVNAFPKLKKHLKTHQLPPPANSSYEELEFIYDTLTNPFEDSEPSTNPLSLNPNGSSHSTDQSKDSDLSSDEPEGYDDQYDVLDDTHSNGDVLDMTSHNPLAALTRDYLKALCEVVAKWITDVERARGQSALVEEYDPSPETEQYAAEPVRAPPTVDWHDWKSEFASWWLVLPEERGVLSSNDRVEIRNLPSLTKRMDNS